MGVFILLLVTNSPPRTLKHWDDESMRTWGRNTHGSFVAWGCCYRDLIFLPSNLLLGGVVRSEWASTLLGFVEDEDGAAAASAVPSLLPVSTTAKFVLPTTQQQLLLWLLILLLTRMTTGKNDARLGWKTDLTMLDGISADDGCWNRISHSSFCHRLRLLQQLESVMGHQGRKEIAAQHLKF